MFHQVAGKLDRLILRHVWRQHLPSPVASTGEDQRDTKISQVWRFAATSIKRPSLALHWFPFSHTFYYPRKVLPTFPGHSRSMNCFHSYQQWGANFSCFRTVMSQPDAQAPKYNLSSSPALQAPLLLPGDPRNIPNPPSRKQSYVQ